MSFVSSEGFARIEIELPSDVHPHSSEADELRAAYSLNVAVGDIANCFHKLLIDEELSKYFCLPPIPAHVLGLGGVVLNGARLSHDSLVWPCPCALPMGFSWSPFFCQSMTETISARATFSTPCCTITDDGPPPVFSATKLQSCQYNYIDNFGSITGGPIKCDVMRSSKEQLDNTADAFRNWTTRTRNRVYR